LAAIIRGLTDQMTRNTALALRGDARAVHDARVAARRLREALSVAAGPSRRDAVALRRTTRRLRSELGPVREADVLLTLLNACARRRHWPPMAVAHVRSALLARRRLATRRMTRVVAGVDLARVLASSARVTSALTRAPHVRDSRTLLRARASSRAEGVVRALRRAGPLYVPEAFHEARIAAKKLRYVLELAPSLGLRVPRADIGVLRVAQDTLGRLHDLQDLQGAIHGVGAELAADRRQRRALAAMSTGVAAECRRIHAAFLPTRPRVARAAERAAAVAISSGAPRPGKV
jgi:CHAD domain-containing protein